MVASLCLAFIFTFILSAQQPADWRPSIAEDNKKATWEDTVNFIVATMNDATVNKGEYGNSHTGRIYVETFLTSTDARCKLKWNEQVVDQAGAKITLWEVDLNKLDPLTIVVVPFDSREIQSGYRVQMRGTSSFAFAKGNSSRWPPRVWSTMNEPKSMICTSAGSASCAYTEQTSSSVSIFLSDREMSQRLARALMHGAVLCGGSRAVSPF